MAGHVLSAVGRVGIAVALSAAVAACTDWEAFSKDYQKSGNPTKACATFVVAGDAHSCARHASGELSCWGDNRFGQLGTGDQQSRATPTLVDLDGKSIAKIYAPVGTGDISLDNARFTCGITADEHFLCWGNDRFGFGAGKERVSSVPVLVDVPGPAKATSGAGHTCVQDKNGALSCWGNNLQGQLGLGDTRSRFTPERVDVDGKLVERLSAGSDFTCIGTIDGALYCWGGNGKGQLGIGSTEQCTRPTLVDAITGVTRVTTGASHGCAVADGGRVLCWGDNRFGQLGTGDLTQRTTPTPVASDELTKAPIAVLIAGGNHTCAVRDDGTLWCWGANRFGQLGTKDGEAKSVPTKILGGVTNVYTGGAHTCALKTNGSVWCWGNNQFGQLGVDVGQQSLAPVEVMPACP